jgi:hypothetical protein
MGREEMGNRTLITSREAEKTKSLQDMMMKEMPKRTMMKKIKIPVYMKHRKAGCGTIMFRHCMLLKQTSNARAAAREKAKMGQL